MTDDDLVWLGAVAVGPPHSRRHEITSAARDRSLLGPDRQAQSAP